MIDFRADSQDARWAKSQVNKISNCSAIILQKKHAYTCTQNENDSRSTCRGTKNTNRLCTAIKAKRIKPLGHLSHASQIIPPVESLHSVILVILERDWIDIKIRCTSTPSRRIRRNASDWHLSSRPIFSGRESRNYARKHRLTGDWNGGLTGFMPSTLSHHRTAFVRAISALFFSSSRKSTKSHQRRQLIKRHTLVW